MVVLGGFIHSSGVILWSLTSPVGALLFDNRRKAAVWFLGFAALVVVTGLMELGVFGIITQFLPQQGVISNQLLTVFFIMNILGPSVVVFLLLVYFTRQRDRNYELLLAEQSKSDGLLLNILPQTIARRLKDGDVKIAECVGDASILFADVAGFTPLSAELGVEAVVDLLNDMHTGFDDIMEKHGLEKIRTIGDGYMAVSGLPTPRRDHAIAIADAALEMLDFVRSLKLPGGRTMALRIGINSGEIMAGVIGRKKFSYDVWGDPVNVASRMESHGLSNCIQITEATYRLIKDDFICAPRGVVEIKGKGEMRTWFLIAKKEGQSDDIDSLAITQPQ
jgi:guanylate cyclase